jgi:hypothetical protein
VLTIQAFNTYYLYYNTTKNMTSPESSSPESSTAKDKTGNVNVSRGIIGLNSNNTQSSSITEGTVADRVNQPSRSPNTEGRVNPVTEEDLDKRIQLERSRGGMDRARQEQIAIKARIEAQGFKYEGHEDFRDDPELAPTPDNFQEGEPTANREQGEQVIDVDNDAANQQKNSTDNIKG